jgi:hypothetical protein
MAKKVKVMVLTDRVRLRLPGLRIGFILWLAPMIIESSLERHPTNDWWYANKPYWKQVFKEIKQHFKALQPFTLVEVDSAEAKIRIEVK